MARTPSLAKRAAILNAAEALFTEKGFPAVSMDEVAKVAQVSKRTVYNHFENKAALFGAIIDDELATPPGPNSRGSFDPELPLEDQLDAMLEARFEALFEAARFRRIRLIIGETLRSPELAQAFAEKLDAFAELLSPWLIEATNHGALNVPNPKERSAIFWRSALGIGFWPALLQNDPKLRPEAKALLRQHVRSFIASGR